MDSEYGYQGEVKHELTDEGRCPEDQEGSATDHD
jgi:hypothetical protein